MADRYSLAEARAIIDGEKCELHEHEGQPWCSIHDGWMPRGLEFCYGAPADLVAVAAQLLATVERVQALADEWAAEVKLYHWCGGCTAPDPERVELLAAINGEEVT